jgi:hypothetical protein
LAFELAQAGFDIEHGLFKFEAWRCAGHSRCNLELVRVSTVEKYEGNMSRVYFRETVDQEGASILPPP